MLNHHTLMEIFDKYQIKFGNELLSQWTKIISLGVNKYFKEPIRVDNGFYYEIKSEYVIKKRETHSTTGKYSGKIV